MFDEKMQKSFKKKAYEIAEKKVKEFYKECGWEDYKYMIPEFAEVIAIGMEKSAETTLRKVIKYLSTCSLDACCNGYFSWLLKNEEKLQDFAKELENV